MRVYIISFLCMVGLLCAEEAQVILCENGKETAQWALELIQHAEQSIDFCPCFTGGELMDELFLAIEERMQTFPKLRAHILMSTFFLEPSNIALIERLRQQYSRQFQLTYTTSVMDFQTDIRAIDNHVKLLIIDETYFISGGSNYDYAICSEGTFTPTRRPKDCIVGSRLPSGSRDQDFIGKSRSIARELRIDLHNMIAMWKDFQTRKHFSSYNPDDFADVTTFYEIDPTHSSYISRFDDSSNLLTCKNLYKVMSGPMHIPNHIAQEYSRLIDQAETEILIGNLHFAPTDSIFESLLRAIRRGVKVTVITNGVHEFSPNCTTTMSLANILYYIPALYGKTYRFWEKKKCERDSVYPTAIHEYFVDDILYHKKVMVVDEKFFLIGSYNLGLRSDISDYELVFVMESPEVAQEAKKILQRDLQYTRQVTPSQARTWYFTLTTFYEAELQKMFNCFF